MGSLIALVHGKRSLSGGGGVQINPFPVLGWSVARPGVMVSPALQFSFVGSCFPFPSAFGSGGGEGSGRLSGN